LTSRLCILKGIYPHDPKHKKKLTGGSSSLTTYYHVKDIKHLLHEPILATFRESKTFGKKVRKLIGKKEWFLAKRFIANKKPSYALDHVIKERYPSLHLAFLFRDLFAHRYPSFKDALKDLDDCLCHLSVFASLPTVGAYNERVSKECQHLCYAFQHYVMATHSLRKAFLSVKGIYYEAEIGGEKVTWLAPYEFSQHVPPNVDFRVMLTFLEFYRAFIGFVNYKLYLDAGFAYPPRLAADEEDAGVGLMSLKLEETAEGRRADAQEEDSAVALGGVDASGALPEAAALAQRVRERDACRTLFRDLTVYVSREVPKDAAIFVLRSFGCTQIGWQHTPSPLAEGDPRITHHIVDRPVVQDMYMQRKYVQPQWLFDCANAQKILKEEVYAPGATLPPHLSPFVTAEDGDSDAEATEKPSGALLGDEPDGQTQLEMMNIAKAERQHMRKLQAERQDAKQEVAETGNVETGGKGEKEGIVVNTAEKSSKKTVSPHTTAARPKLTREEKELALSMMSKKKRKLYEAMQRGIKNRQVEKDRLKAKKAKLGGARLSNPGLV
jgi:pescadillo